MENAGCQIGTLDETTGVSAKRPAEGCNGGSMMKSQLGYGNGPDYWNTRYETDSAPFDWLQGYAQLKHIIEETAGGSKAIKILHVGCGNSLLPEDMYDDGYHHIVNIDNSGIVIEQMAQRNQLRKELQWLEMDATNMSFSADSFDLVIDKSVLDTFACGDSAPQVIAAYLNQIHRVLRPSGVYICISYGAPETRLSCFQSKRAEFSVKQLRLPKKDSNGEHYIYVLQKSANPGAAPDDQMAGC